jgi:predicted peroxiredoxin
LTGKTVLIHLTANFKENDGPVCVAFNAAWQALRDGAKVTIFFDQDAAYGIKQWEPGKTDLGLYPLPDRIKDLLAESFGVERDSLPADYQKFLSMLHEQGARVVVNGFWNALTEIEKAIKGRENILPYAEPLTLSEILAAREQADVYLKF